MFVGATVNTLFISIIWLLCLVRNNLVTMNAIVSMKSEGITKRLKIFVMQSVN